MDRERGDLVVDDIVIVNLPAGAAADDIRFREDCVQLVKARFVRERAPGAEIEHEIGAVAFAEIARPGPGRAPSQFFGTHAMSSCKGLVPFGFPIFRYMNFIKLGLRRARRRRQMRQLGKYFVLL